MWSQLSPILRRPNDNMSKSIIEYTQYTLLFIDIFVYKYKKKSTMTFIVMGMVML
jgi:hypothetical protein